jgi:amino acid transporter
MIALPFVFLFFAWKKTIRSAVQEDLSAPTRALFLILLTSSLCPVVLALGLIGDFHARNLFVSALFWGLMGPLIALFLAFLKGVQARWFLLGTVFSCIFGTCIILMLGMMKNDP